MINIGMDQNPRRPLNALLAAFFFIGRMQAKNVLSYS
jgi:hypothetical protein